MLGRFGGSEASAPERGGGGRSSIDVQMKQLLKQLQ